jgi:hypothetical protein
VVLSWLFVSSVLAGQKSPANKGESQKASWLFVVKLDGASLQRVSGANYRLSVKVKHVKSIIAFTDRPVRKMVHLSLLNFLYMTHVGRD